MRARERTIGIRDRATWEINDLMLNHSAGGQRRVRSDDANEFFFSWLATARLDAGVVGGGWTALENCPACRGHCSPAKFKI